MLGHLYDGIEPEVRFIYKLHAFQLVAIIFLMIITPLYPDGEITGWLYDFLPPSLFVAEYFPLTSKVINNYVAFSTPLLGIYVFIRKYDEMNKRLAKMGYWGRCKLFAGLCFTVLAFMVLYFGYTGYFLIDFSQMNHSKYSGKYDFFVKNYIFSNVVTFPIISMAFSLCIACFLLFFSKVFQCLWHLLKRIFQ